MGTELEDGGTRQMSGLIIPPKMHLLHIPIVQHPDDFRDLVSQERRDKTARIRMLWKRQALPFSRPPAVVEQGPSPQHRLSRLSQRGELVPSRASLASQGTSHGVAEGMSANKSMRIARLSPKGPIPHLIDLGPPARDPAVPSPEPAQTPLALRSSFPSYRDIYHPGRHLASRPDYVQTVRMPPLRLPTPETPFPKNGKQTFFRESVDRKLTHFFIHPDWESENHNLARLIKAGKDWRMRQGWM